MKRTFAVVTLALIGCSPPDLPPSTTALPAAPVIDYAAERRADDERRAKDLARAKENAVAFLKAARAGSGPFSTVLDAAPNRAVSDDLEVYFGAGLWDQLNRRSQRSLVMQAHDLWKRTHCADAKRRSRCAVWVNAYDGDASVSVAHTGTSFGETSIEFDDR